MPTADSKQDGGASASQATLGGPGSALRKRPPLLPAAGTQPRPEEPAPWRAGAPPTQARKPRPHLGGSTPTGTGSRGAAQEDQGAWELAGCPGSRGWESRGTPRRWETPLEAALGRMPGRGCRVGRDLPAENSPEQGKGTKAPRGTATSGDMEQPGQWPQGSPFPTWAEGGPGQAKARWRSPGLCISLTAAESPATPQPPQSRLEALS